MASKHTPGPWHKDENCIMVRKPEREFLGDGAPETICEMMSSVSPEETDANARLIAAAPEMLDALQHIAETADGSWDREDVRLRTGRADGREIRDALQSIGNMARAVIAKATRTEE